MDHSWLAQLDPDTVKPGAVGLLVVLALVVATALLLRSFTRQLKKIDFDEDGDEDGDGDGTPSSTGDGPSPPEDERALRERDL